MNKRSRQSTRREFLQGKSAVDAVGDLGRSLDQASSVSPAEPTTSGRTYLIQVSRRAMACEFEVFLNAGEHAAGAERAIEALDLIEQLEDQLSVYRHRSEVSLLNHTAAHRPVRVETRLFGLLEQAVRLFADTQGAFDITAGPLIKAWSRLRREGIAPTAEQLEELLTTVGSRHLQLDPQQLTLAYQQAGVTIDLGAIGKGYALDRCAELLAAAEVSDYLLHGGTSSILARGQRRAGHDRAGWTVGVQHPLRADRRLAEIQLCDRAIGTSGAGTQQFYYQGQKLGHIIDPRTGHPATGVLSTTVIATTATAADALSTAFYVLGVAEAEAYCRQHPEVSALMTTVGRAAGSIELHPLNCSDLDWRRVD